MCMWWSVGGGWRDQSSAVSSAGIVGITILIFAVILCLIALTYCFVRRPRILRRQITGGRASDYIRRCDATAQIPSPPPYDAGTMTLPPSYSMTDLTDKPPDYEVVLLNNGHVLYRPHTEHNVSDRPHTEHNISESNDQQRDSRSSETSVWLE